MTNSHLIGPASGSTPAEPGTRARSLPYDLLKDASRRLEIMSVVAAVLWVLSTAGARITLLTMPHGNRIWYRGYGTEIIAGISVLASLALFFYIRNGDRDPRFILDLGLAYLVFTRAALGLVIHWYPLPQELGQEKGATAMMLAHLQKVPVAPSKRSEIMVPAGLDRAIMMCLAKETSATTGWR